MNIDRKQILRYIGFSTLVVVAYYLTAKLGFSLAFETQQVTAVWPPTAIAISVFILLGANYWPSVLIGAFWVNAISNEPLLTAAGIAVGNTLGPLVGGLIARRLKFNTRIERIRDISILVLCGMFSMLITASNGVANLVIGDIIPIEKAFSVWKVWWIGDTMGVVLFAPLLLILGSNGRNLTEKKEMLNIVKSIFIITLFALISFGNKIPLAYPIFPITILVALRFDQLINAIISPIISIIAIWMTVHGYGPFTYGSLDEQLMLLVTFTSTMAISSLIIGAITLDRKIAFNDLKKLHQEVEGKVIERTSELKRINEELEQFVYAASHDLRAPLRSIHAFTQLLQRRYEKGKILDDKAQEYFGFIQSGVKSMEDLIDNLLKYSRVIRVKDISENVDLENELKFVLNSIKGLILERGAIVTHTKLPKVFAIKTHCEQLLQNLIVNAIKFSPGDSPKVQIDAIKENDFWHLTVKDYGIGIASEFHEKIFELFQRLNSQEEYEGSGVGLAICEKIVRLNGGKIWVESEEGKGSTFHFTLKSAIQEGS